MSTDTNNKPMTDQPPVYHEGVLHYDINSIQNHEDHHQQHDLQQQEQPNQNQNMHNTTINDNKNANNYEADEHIRPQSQQQQYGKSENQQQNHHPQRQQFYAPQSYQGSLRQIPSQSQFDQERHKIQSAHQLKDNNREIYSASTMNSSVRVRTILDIDSQHELNEPLMNSPRSLQACQIAGFPVTSLQKKDKGYLERKLKGELPSEGVQMLAENQEKRRQEKIAKVIELRQKIMEGSLSKEEKKLLQGQCFFKPANESMLFYTPQRPSSNKSYQELQTSSLGKSETHFSQMSPDASSKLEKTKQNQIKEIEALIEDELKMNILYNSVEEKNRRLEEIAVHKSWLMEKRRREIEEIQKQKKDRLQQHQQKEQEAIRQKEQNIFLKQSLSAQKLSVIKQLRDKALEEESQRENERIEQAKLSVAEQKQKRYEIAERQYLENHERFLRNQEEQQLLLSQSQKDKSEQEKLALERKQKRDQLMYSKIESVRAKLERKHIQTEEKQRLIQEVRKGNLSSKPSRIQSATALGYSHNASREQLPDDVAKELEAQEKLNEHRQREIQVFSRKQILVAAEQRRVEEEYIKRQQSTDNKLEVFQKGKQQQVISLKSQNLMKTLNAQDNTKRLEYMAANRNLIINEKQAARNFQDLLKEQEAVLQNKEREYAYTKLSIERQRIKEELGKTFQKNRKVNVSLISQKFGLPLDSEENLMSRSMADLGKSRSQTKIVSSQELITSKYSNTPYSQTPYFSQIQPRNIYSAKKQQY